MSSGSNPAKPKLACEIAADRVLVGDWLKMAVAWKLPPRANWRPAA